MGLELSYAHRYYTARCTTPIAIFNTLHNNSTMSSPNKFFSLLNNDTSNLQFKKVFPNYKTFRFDLLLYDSV